jgi:predicted Rossmann-fold nucleotide-binding protein
MNSTERPVSLNESPDCEIEDVISATPKEVRAVVSVRLCDEQLSYFARNMECLNTDLHSTKARLGINQEKDGAFLLEENKIFYTARFWFYIPEYSSGVTIDRLMKPGLKVGKIYLKNPKLKYSASELINLICNRTIIVPKGTKVLEEGALLIPVMPFVHLPNPAVLTREYLKAAVMKKIPREDLCFAQPEQRVDQIVIPSGSGVVSHTTLFTQSNEIFILDAEHTDARVGSKYTNGIIYLEFMGGDEDVLKKDIRIEVFKPAPFQEGAKSRFHIDVYSASLDTLYEKNFLGDGGIAVSENGDKERIIDFAEKRFDYLLKTLKPDSSVMLHNFPNRLLASYLIVAADLGLIKNLIFKKAPEQDYFFSSENLAFMDKLQDMGVCISWKNKIQGDLVLHNRFFMRSAIIPSFVEAFDSRKLAAIYGTAGAVDAGTEKEIVDSVKSFKEFHGGICGILTGGSAGSIMSFVSETTKSLGMLTGAVYWKIPGVEFYPHVDFAAYLGRNDLLERQEILSHATEADIYFKGGVGTNLENAITFVKKKLGIGYYKPQIFVGAFYNPLKDWLHHLTSEQMADPAIFKSCYFIKHGNEVFKTLCHHFGSEDKMLSEITRNNHP